MITSPIIYLAGGFRSRWQQRVRKALPGFEFRDPSTHGIEDPLEYTKWDLHAIAQSDLVLANIEGSNPGLYSLSLEVGFASAHGKLVVLVEDDLEAMRSRYFEMVRQVADQRFSTLDDAVDWLRQTDPLAITKRRADLFR